MSRAGAAGAKRVANPGDLHATSENTAIEVNFRIVSYRETEFTNVPAFSYHSNVFPYKSGVLYCRPAVSQLMKGQRNTYISVVLGVQVKILRVRGMFDVHPCGVSSRKCQHVEREFCLTVLNAWRT